VWQGTWSGPQRRNEGVRPGRKKRELEINESVAPPEEAEAARPRAKKAQQTASGHGTHGRIAGSLFVPVHAELKRTGRGTYGIGPRPRVKLEVYRGLDLGRRPE
jgi:hypothetical protein